MKTEIMVEAGPKCVIITETTELQHDIIELRLARANIERELLHLEAMERDLVVNKKRCLKNKAVLDKVIGVLEKGE